MPQALTSLHTALRDRDRGRGRDRDRDRDRDKVRGGGGGRGGGGRGTGDKVRGSTGESRIRNSKEIIRSYIFIKWNYLHSDIPVCDLT